MKKQILANLLLIIGALMFNLLFWSQGMGLNVFLFTCFLIAASFKLNLEALRSKAALGTAFGTLIAAIGVMVHHSMMSIVVHLISTFTMIGFVQHHSLRFLAYGFLMSFHNTFQLPRRFKQEVVSLAQLIPIGKRVFQKFHLLVFPAIVFPMFFYLYFRANPNFAALSTDFALNIRLFIVDHFNIGRLIFFGLGLAICGIAFWDRRLDWLLNMDASKSEILVRKRERHFMQSGMLALKNEYRSAVIMVFSLNALLAIVNFLDIKYVWMEFEPSSPVNLQQYVHEGTYTLIGAILCAMTVVLFFFRKNINFLQGNHLLKTLAYAWIAQNAVLAISVAIRNYRYIYYYGLAYKRIGVMIFLAMVIFGLVTMVFKIKYKRSNFFLLHRNSWAIYACFILLTCINWDVLITKYNLTVKTDAPIDFVFLTTGMSDKNLYLLEEYFQSNTANSVLAEGVAIKRYKYKKRLKGKDWRSWNLADQKNEIAIAEQLE